MPKQNIYERLAEDLNKYYGATVKRLSKDLLGGQNPPFRQRLSPEQQKQFWYDLPDQAPPGERSKMSTWSEADAEDRQRFIEWERERGSDAGSI